MINEVYLINNMEFMAKCKDNEFDLIIDDPEYGKKIMKIWGSKKFGYKQYKEKEWDNQIPTKDYFKELFRVSKNQIIWGGNYFTEYLPNSQGWIVWDKGQRNFTLADGELAFSSFDKALRIFEYSRSLSNFNDEKIHINQKPVALYKWLLNNYAEKGWKIGDFHVGSGSSRIAAYELGFDYEGCENDIDYWNAQEARFKLEKAKIDGKFYLPDNEANLFNKV